MSAWDAWIGRETVTHDMLDHGLVTRWLATFDLPVPRDGFLPQGVHFCLGPPDAATAQLGQDGHPVRDQSTDSFLPPFPMPRRMWASSAIEFRTPLVAGALIERKSKVVSVSEKEGGSGRLAFVNVEHQTWSNGTIAVVETQTLVYREAASREAPLSPPDLSEHVFDPSEWDKHRLLVPNSRLLFRYSALTFNSHRIHYDVPYAREVERYRGLVVHGPLTASLLLQLAASHHGENALRSFEFRGISPAIVDEPLHLVMRARDDGHELGAFAVDGRQITKAKATP